jgi:hypothetical protein
MLHRTERSVAIMLSILGTLLLGTPGPILAATAPASDVSIRFDDIEAYVRAESPRAQIIAQKIAVVTTERDRALQWSNPAVAYDHEENEVFREWQVTLRKRFVMPFSQSSLKDGWQDRVRSAELRGSQESENLLAELKAGYVRLQLFESYLDRLTQLAGLVDHASSVAGSRYVEGELSGTEKQLIQLAAFSVDATSRRIRQEHRQYAAFWRAEMGLFSNVTMDLITPVTFLPFELDDAGEYAAMLSHRPGNQAQSTLAQALGRHAEAARPSLVPGIDLYGGYKNFNSVLDGFVAGIALDLPLFDGNSGASKRFEAQRLIVENELAITLARSREEIASLVAAVREAQPSLAEFAERLDQGPPLADTLLFSYQEGSITLDALLGAIQIESAAVENYFAELAGYYLNIFRLEAITGASIVHFAP